MREPLPESKHNHKRSPYRCTRDRFYSAPRRGHLQVGKYQQSLLQRLGPGRHLNHVVAMVFHPVQPFGFQRSHPQHRIQGEFVHVATNCEFRKSFPAVSKVTIVCVVIPLWLAGKDAALPVRPLHLIEVAPS